MFSRKTHLAVAVAAACSFNQALAEQEQIELDAQTVVGSSTVAEVDSYKSTPAALRPSST